ncbi:unnamed protein product [Polarella glacialis]|uniref:Histone-lysine N-methyltransferase, H3 lysine-79 specific n=1 Tax=Polarella glacialis TaxID=89957 RepID=A0A813FRJ1_POLGL|nr:unnamed protein product [Polarella glacialis]
MLLAGSKRAPPPSKLFLQVATDLPPAPEPEVVAEMDLFFDALLPVLEAEAAMASDEGEVVALFAPRGADPAGLELPLVESWRLLHSMELGESDVFVDLGCSLGRVAFLASLMTGCKSVGVELSPRRSKMGRDAVGRLPDALAALRSETSCGLRGNWQTEQLQSQMEMHEGDLLDADLSEATFVFLSVRCLDAALMVNIVECVVSSICRCRQGVTTRLLAPAFVIDNQAARLLRAFSIDGYGGETRVFAEYEVRSDS